MFTVHCLLTDMNARLNNVAINITNTDFVSDMKIGTSDDWDVVLVGDMFYENPLADELTEWLRLEKEAGKFIYIGDPGRYLFIAAQHKPGNYLEFITRYKLGMKMYQQHGFFDTEVWKVFYLSE